MPRLGRPSAALARLSLALAVLALTACAGPLTHVPTDPRWLDPASGRGTTTTPPPAPPGDAPLRFVIYGDTRGNRRVHRAVVEAITHANPSLVLFTGDALSCLPVGHMPD